MSDKMQPLIIRSGGQTGADRGALDAALAVGVAICGWIPRGRLAEDGPLDAKYPLEETESNRYAIRTDWNVRDADATLIISRKPLEGGTALTEEYAVTRRKPCMVFDPYEETDIDNIVQWLQQCQIKVLNVAGPRESKCPGIYQQAFRVIQGVLTQVLEQVE